MARRPCETPPWLRQAGRGVAMRHGALVRRVAQGQEIAQRLHRLARGSEATPEELEAWAVSLDALCDELGERAMRGLSAELPLLLAWATLDVRAESEGVPTDEWCAEDVSTHDVLVEAAEHVETALTHLLGGVDDGKTPANPEGTAGNNGTSVAHGTSITCPGGEA